MRLICALDWSRDQLEKHSREIMSLFGNLYLRVTSKKIQERVEGAESPSVVDIARRAPDGSTLRDLLHAIGGLKELFQKRMQGLLIADALDDIMLVLQKARRVFSRN